MPRYYTFGGQPIQYAGQWNGFPSRLSRVASETRGLSGLGSHDGLGKDPEVEYLPFRASGPEPLDPGEIPFLSSMGLFDNLSDNEKRFGMVAGALALGWFLLKGRSKGRAKRKNPARARKTKDEWIIQQFTGGGYGWEDVHAEETWKGAKRGAKEYRDNQPEYAVRIIKRRVKK